MAMFIRVKRKKTTFFLHCDPSEMVLETKQKLHTLSDFPVDQQRLILLSTKATLDDNRSLADQKVENDAVVALTLKIPETGEWEDVNIEKPADHANLIESESS
ncbi:hypothetical protein CY35_04G107500 [Sphagnum magellanicum]|nr:hypothetical protein CY35_04G107500 [Sphagnum magellanicum]